MKWLTFEIQREPGFRFNLIDLFLIVGIVAITFALYLASPESHFVWLPLYVGFSFFLFCNVFRIGNRMGGLLVPPLRRARSLCVRPP